MKVNVTIPFNPPLECTKENVDRLFEILSKPEYQDLVDIDQTKVSLAVSAEASPPERK